MPHGIPTVYLGFSRFDHVESETEIGRGMRIQTVSCRAVSKASYTEIAQVIRYLVSNSC